MFIDEIKEFAKVVRLSLSLVCVLAEQKVFFVDANFCPLMEFEFPGIVFYGSTIFCFIPVFNRNSINVNSYRFYNGWPNPNILDRQADNILSFIWFSLER